MATGCGGTSQRQLENALDRVARSAKREREGQGGTRVVFVVVNSPSNDAL